MLARCGLRQFGIAADPELKDGGTITVPYFRFYDTDSRWSVKNEGVAPDIEVALDRIETNRGRDRQLLRAIEETVRELRDFRDQAPAYPTGAGH